MADEEAIKDIKENVKPVVGGVSLDMAIEALQKQIPVKPKVFENVGDMFFWKCPACGAEWFENHVHQYCTDCGQRFDLSVWLKQEVEV